MLEHVPFVRRIDKEGKALTERVFHPSPRMRSGLAPWKPIGRRSPSEGHETEEFLATMHLSRDDLT